MGVLVSMAAGAALAVPLIGAPLPTCGVLVVLATWYTFLRRQRRSAAGRAAVRPDDVVEVPGKAHPPVLRRKGAGSTNRHAA